MFSNDSPKAPRLMWNRKYNPEPPGYRPGYDPEHLNFLEEYYYLYSDGRRSITVDQNPLNIYFDFESVPFDPKYPMILKDIVNSNNIQLDKERLEKPTRPLEDRKLEKEFSELSHFDKIKVDEEVIKSWKTILENAIKSQFQSVPDSSLDSSYYDIFIKRIVTGEGTSPSPGSILVFYEALLSNSIIINQFELRTMINRYCKKYEDFTLQIHTTPELVSMISNLRQEIIQQKNLSLSGEPFSPIKQETSLTFDYNDELNTSIITSSSQPINEFLIKNNLIKLKENS